LLQEDVAREFAAQDLPSLDSMGLEVMEIAELAALRSIQTTIASRPLTTAGDADAHDTADTGCVTPTTAEARSLCPAHH